MPKRRRPFKRSTGQRNYRKLFVIAVEGSKTEPQYFDILNNHLSAIHVKCLKGKPSNSPLTDTYIEWKAYQYKLEGLNKQYAGVENERIKIT